MNVERSEHPQMRTQALDLLCTVYFVFCTYYVRDWAGSVSDSFSRSPRLTR